MPPAAGESLDERGLVARCLAGDRAAREVFAQAYAPVAAAAVRAVYRRWGIPLAEPELDDILQETLAAFFREDLAPLREFRWECSLAAYVRTVAASRAAHFRRRLGTEASHLERLRREVLARDPAAEPPDAPIGRDEAARRLCEAVDRLSQRERRVLLAFYWEGATGREIGRLLDLAPEHVHVILDRARKRLREFLREGR